MQWDTFNAVKSSFSKSDNRYACQLTVVYPADSLSQLKKYLNSISCMTKMIQNGLEAVQAVDCGFNLCTQHAQVTIVGLWLDLNQEFTSSQDSIPQQWPRDIILGSDSQIPLWSWLKHPEKNQEWSKKRSAHIWFSPILRKPGVSINHQT